MTNRTVCNLRINGEEKEVSVRGSDTLLDTLREKLGLTGTKNGCANGDCGTCTVLVDGWPVKACQMLAMEAEGHQITTIEGLGDLRLEQAFTAENALQCGFCTPGFILNSHALTEIHPDADKQTVEDWLGSNLCRCTCYEEIRKAVQSVLTERQGTAGLGAAPDKVRLSAE